MWKIFHKTRPKSGEIKVDARITENKNKERVNWMKEKTLVLIKPDGVQRALIGEIIKRFETTGLKIIAIDGFYVGYGLFRLKKYHRIFRFLGGAANRLSRILDKFTGRFFSKKFGFEILAVGEKVRQLR